MIRNYLTIAFRNLTKRRGYSFLNIAGLTIGMTCCMLIFHHVSFEKSYDQFSPVAKDIVRLRLDNYQKGKLAWQSATIYPAIAPTIRKDFPEVQDFCRLHDAELLLTNDANEVKFTETKGYFADPSFVKMFNLDLLKGNPATALDAPDKMLISESMSKKYFGNAEAIGKNLTVRDPGHTQTYQVTGVFKEYPKNSHLMVDYLVSYSTLGKLLRQDGDTSNATETSWGWYDFYSYLQLKPGTDYKQLESKLPAFCDRYINSQEWYKANNNRAALYLMPLTDIHLYSNFNQEAEVNGNGQAVSFLFLVAIFIIGIAWINYINLATARSVERAREVGVRKVLGAARSSLIRQFVVESVLLNIIAFTLSLIAFYLLLPLFDQFVGRDTATGISLTSKYWLLFIALFAGGTMLSGLYPSIVLSSFQPITVLKGVFKNTSGGIGLRKGLIVIQFVTSVVLIAGTIIVYQQVSYMRKQQLGVNIEQTLVLQGAGSLQDSVYLNVFQPFKNELRQQRNIHAVSASTSVMGNEIYWTSGVMPLDKPNQTAVTLYHLGIDEDFLPAYDLKIVAGRNFSKDFPAEQKAVLINERTVELLGFKNAEEVVERKLRLRRGRDTVTVVGVVSNYHHQGLQKVIDPMILLYRPNTRNYYSIKIGTNDVQQTISSVQKVWSKYFPADPLNYFFLDETFNQQYKSDALFGKVFGVFAFLAILIACFGLFGLSAYNVLQRAKEIGIRKVLGASVQNILLMLSKDFLKLILLALVLAIPVGWFIMNEWLQDFAYRIHITWWVFAVAGIISLGISLLVISLQAIKAAVENPVKSLRTE